MKTTATYWNLSAPEHEARWEVVDGSDGNLLQLTVAEDPSACSSALATHSWPVPFRSPVGRADWSHDVELELRGHRGHLSPPLMPHVCLRRVSVFATAPREAGSSSCLRGTMRKVSAFADLPTAGTHWCTPYDGNG